MTTPPLPSWAAGPQGAPPAPGSLADRQLAAFIGPRWPSYRRKFAPFFQDPRFTPTWNWAAALTVPLGAVWFLYRKLYIPFVFFWVAPGLVVGLLWQGDTPPTMRELSSGSPAATDALLIMAGVVLSTMILAGGTANFLLFRRAQAAMRVIGAQAPGEGAVPLLARVGQVNRTGTIIVLVLLFALQFVQAGLLQLR